jgi:chemotaxis protein MotA
VNIIIGLVIVFGCIIGSFMAGGGHVNVLWQPYEFIVILGAGLGAFIAGYPLRVIKDSGKALG